MQDGTSDYVFKPTAEEVACIIQAPSRGGGLTRRYAFMSITREYFAKQLAIPLRASGFKKVGSTWRRDSEDGVHVVNAQASQWGPDFFINLGFYIRALGDEPTPHENLCHVRERLEHIGKSAEQVASAADEWFRSFGSLEQLAQHARGGTLPLIVTAKALELAREA